MAADPRRGDDLQGGPRGRWFGRLAQDVRFARDPYQRPHRATLDVPGGPPGGTRPGTGSRGAHARKGDFEVVEGGTRRRLPRLQPERQGSDGRIGLLHTTTARCARLHAAVVGRGADLPSGGVPDPDGPGTVTN